MRRQRRAAQPPSSLEEKLQRLGQQVDRTPERTKLQPVMAADEENEEEPVNVAEEAAHADEDVEWTADAPPLHPDDVAAALANSVRLEVTPSDADCDRLWDWIRADADRGAAFFGAPQTSYRSMLTVLMSFGDLLASIYDSTADGQDVHVGFVGIKPLTDDVACPHLYLGPEARGDAPRLVPQILRLGNEMFPGRKWVLTTEDAALARLYRGLGFSMAYLVTWTPPAA